MSDREQFEAAFFANPSGGGLNEFCWRIWQAARAQPAQAEAVPSTLQQADTQPTTLQWCQDCGEGYADFCRVKSNNCKMKPKVS